MYVLSLAYGNSGFVDFVMQCVLTDQRIRAIERVHGYFSSEQVQTHTCS